ncbi:MAG: OsmC family protein [Planctomycetaceae bacterium]
MSDTPTSQRRVLGPPYRARIDWQYSGSGFSAGQYSREHVWEFDGGLSVLASPSPHVVPAPWSNVAHVDPEEGLVAAVASCHMLTFLWVAGRRGWTVTRYVDDAQGLLTRDERRVTSVSEIILRPAITWEGTPPTAEELAELHAQAHEQCIIANSVRAEIRIAAP